MQCSSAQPGSEPGFGIVYKWFGGKKKPLVDKLLRLLIKGKTRQILSTSLFSSKNLKDEWIMMQNIQGRLKMKVEFSHYNCFPAIIKLIVGLHALHASKSRAHVAVVLKDRHFYASCS